jgi:hypothetical protein
MSVPEVANRATISGAIEIGRHPGVVHVTFRAPVERIAASGLLDYAREQYGDVPTGAVEGASEGGNGAGGNGAGGTASGTTSATPGTEGTAPSGA